MVGIAVLAVVVLVAVAVVSTRTIGRRSAHCARVGGASGGRRARDAEPSALERQLGEWRDAGLLEARQIEPIVRYEDAQHAPRSRIPIAAEAVGYVGAALVIGAVVSLVANNFSDMAVGARVAVLLAPAVVAAIAGWFVGGDPDPAFERLGSVLWVLAAGLLAGTLVEVFVDVIHDGDAPDHGGLLFVSGITLAWAVTAYALRRLPLQHLVLFAAGLASVLGVLDAIESGRDASLPELVWSFAVWLFGAIWFAAGVEDLLTPPVVARVLGAAAVLVGAQLVRVTSDVPGLWLGLASAAALLAIGVARTDALVLLVGAAGLFQWSPQVAIYYLEPAIGIEATLMIVGVLLIVAATGFTRLYRRLRSAAEPPTRLVPP